jgi:hypothetical protein
MSNESHVPLFSDSSGEFLQASEIFFGLDINDILSCKE